MAVLYISRADVRYVDFILFRCLSCGFILVEERLEEVSIRSLTNNSSSTILIGMIFGSLYLGLWYLISFVLGSRFEFESFPSLRGYEDYAVHSLPLAFGLYLSFSVFGAFAEEVAYRGYVQTRISSRFGYVVGIIVATLFFSLEHIHIFQPSWIVKFFET